MSFARCASWPFFCFVFFLSELSSYTFYFNQNIYGAKLHTRTWYVELFC